jgi:hypothetical protein
VLHVHDLNHVQIDSAILLNGLDGIDNVLSEWVGQGWMDLGVEGSAGNLNQQIPSDFFFHLEAVEELEHLKLGLINTVGEHTWVNTLTNVALCLAHELSNEEHIRGGSISDNVVLSSGGTPNHSSGWMLDLHFVEQDATILSQFDLASTANKHLDGSFWSEVRLKDFLETLTGVDIDTESGSLSDNVSLGIDKLEGTHI